MHPRFKETDDTRFDADLRSSSLVLVKFTGQWCPPCRAIQPTLEALVSERADLVVLSLDVDEHQGVAQRYGVRSLPTLIAFRDGRPIGQYVGAASRSTLEKMLPH